MHVQLWPCVIPVPVEVEAHTIPHSKAPINGNIDPWGPECGCTFILDYTLVNVGHLLHKSRPVPFVFSSTVSYFMLTEKGIKKMLNASQKRVSKPNNETTSKGNDALRKKFLAKSFQSG